MLVSIPADVTTRLSIILCALALTAAACGSIPEGEVVSGEGERFVPFVAEFLDDAGLGNGVAVDAEGVPYTSYWIFPAVLEEGEIPVGRPIGAPYITTDDPEPKDGAAIGVASLSAEGVWTRGAAAQVRETPTGVSIPYGPAFDKSLVGATAENTNGTDIAIDDAGGKHVVWTSQNGVSYAGGTDAFSVEKVFDYGFGLRKAGPIGRASGWTYDVRKVFPYGGYETFEFNVPTGTNGDGLQQTSFWNDAENTALDGNVPQLMIVFTPP